MVLIMKPGHGCLIPSKHLTMARRIQLNFTRMVRVRASPIGRPQSIMVAPERLPGRLEWMLQP